MSREIVVVRKDDVGTIVSYIVFAFQETDTARNVLNKIQSKYILSRYTPIIKRGVYNNYVDNATIALLIEDDYNEYELSIAQKHNNLLLIIELLNKEFPDRFIFVLMFKLTCSHTSDNVIISKNAIETIPPIGKDLFNIYTREGELCVSMTD